WRDSSREQLEQSKKLIRKEYERVKSEHQEQNDGSCSHRERRKRPTGECIGAREGGVEQRYRRENEEHYRVEQAINGKRCKRRGEGHVCLLRQCVRSRNLAGACGHHVVHHHPHCRRAPERSEWKLAGQGLENRFPPA